MATQTKRGQRAEPPGGPGGMLYEQVAQKLRAQVTSGVYQQGERVPSVRRLSDQLEVSVSTVIEAYRRAGTQGASRGGAQPEISNPRSSPTDVSVSALALKVLRASRDPDVLQLGVAVPHSSLLPTRALNGILARIARRDAGRGIGYDFPPGSPELRRQIARRALDAGCTLSPEDIVTTSGCQEALSLCLRAVVKPGDTVAIESPAFYGTLQTIEQMGLKAVAIPTCPRKGGPVEARNLGRAPP